MPRMIPSTLLLQSAVVEAPKHQDGGYDRHGRRDPQLYERELPSGAGQLGRHGPSLPVPLGDRQELADSPGPCIGSHGGASCVVMARGVKQRPKQGSVPRTRPAPPGNRRRAARRRRAFLRARPPELVPWRRRSGACPSSTNARTSTWPRQSSAARCPRSRSTGRPATRSCSRACARWACPRAGSSRRHWPSGAALHAVGAALAASLARRWFGTASALVAGLLFALDPVLVHFATQALDSTLSLTLFLAGLDLFAAALAAPERAGRWVGAGVFWAAAALVRPNYLLVWLRAPPCGHSPAGCAAHPRAPGRGGARRSAPVRGAGGLAEERRRRRGLPAVAGVLQPVGREPAGRQWTVLHAACEPSPGAGAGKPRPGRVGPPLRAGDRRPARGHSRDERVLAQPVPRRGLLPPAPVGGPHGTQGVRAR